MGWKTLDDMDLNGKRVLVRVDINVPIVDGVVTDSAPASAASRPPCATSWPPGGKPILLAHFGRPGGERRENLSLNQLVPTLERAFETKVHFAADCVGTGAEGRRRSCSRAKCCCWKTPASTPLKPRTTPIWPLAWRVWARSIATTPFRQRTARIPRPRLWRGCCPPVLAA